MTPFGIAPLLDEGVQYDPYASVLVAKIRAGRYSSDLWDCNGLYLCAPLRPPQQETFAAKSRYTMTAEERRVWGNSYGDAAPPELKAERERRKAKQAERDAEWERVQIAHAKDQAKRDAEREKRRLEWAEEEARLLAGRAEGGEQQGREARAILNGRWECASCLRAAEIEADVLRPGVYVLGCRTCGRSVAADHATLLAMIARKAQLEPATPG